MTYLYIKQHRITGLKYFGMTKRKDPFKYDGSGYYWNLHLKKHGRKYIQTIEIYGFDNQELCTQFALKFSRDNNIVESDEWANLVLEDGYNGNTGFKHTDEAKRKISIGSKKFIRTEQHKSRISQSKMGKTHTEDTKKNMSDGAKRRYNSKVHPRLGKTYTQSQLQCPNCNKIGGISAMKRYHFDNCKSY